MIKNNSRVKRAVKVRKKIFKQKAVRLSIFRTNKNIYAQIISADNSKTIAATSSLSGELKGKKMSGIDVAKIVGEQIAKKAQKAGITNVAFDRSGFLYHGRIKALAEAARTAGLKF
jgi:large subunit ribosomal protein L18